MTVETATYISSLNATYPASSDQKSQGDDHIRLIKSTIKATFPNITGAVTPTQAEINLLANAGTTGASGLNVETQAPGDSTTLAASTAFVQDVAFSAALPDQTGNSGKIVTTDGTNASWVDNLEDNSFSRVMFKDCGYIVVDKGNIDNATVTFDYTAGSVQTYTATGSTVAWAFSNWPPTGNLGELLIIGTNMGAYTHTISGLTWTLFDGTTTTSVATFLAQNSYRTAFQTSGVDKILLVTRDAGSTVYASLVSL